MVNVNYQYGSGGSIGGAPVTNTTYGQYHYYNKPVTIGKPADPWNNPKPGATTGGSSTTQTGNSDAEAWFKDVMAGKNLPFSPQQIAAQTTQQTDMNAAAESARNGQIDANAAAGGASASDPSLQGAKAANFARRQTDNSRAAGQIASQANSANFGAQQQAASQLNQNAMQRAQWAQSNSGVGGAGAFSPWGSGSGGGGSTPSQTVGMGLYGNNYDTNAKDPYGGGVSRPAGQTPGIMRPQRPDSYYEDMGLGGLNNQDYYDMGLG